MILLELFVEFILDHVTHIFDFIKSSPLRAFVQIVAMAISTAIMVAIMLGIGNLAIWIISKK